MIGTFLFLHNLHLDVPRWIFSWKMILVALGVLLGIRHKFRGGPWLVMILVGGIFLMEDIMPMELNIRRYGWPLVLVVIGIYMLLKRPYSRRWEGRDDRWSRGRLPARRAQGWNAGSYNESVQGPNGGDYLSCTAIFGGDNRVVLSKNFQGGDVTAIFGGSEVNFTQADFNGRVVIETTAIFGGIELVVPANWEVKLEVNTIFGGVEEKRPPELMTQDPGKVLVLKGLCIFGGIDIKSY